MPDPPPAVLGVGRALPAHYYDQDALLGYLQAIWSQHPQRAARAEQLHRSVGVRGRHLALAPEAYPALDTFSKANDAWTRAALELGERAIADALDRAGVPARAVDHVFFTTVTGLAVPSLDARLAHRMGMRPDAKRSPLFGLGCAGGAAGVARAADYLRAFPAHTAVLLSVELCSLTFQRDDLSVANMISTGLFGDGAAAVVLGGGRAPRRAPAPRVVASRASLYADTERVMGWDFGERGFKIVLSAEVPEMVRRHLRRDVDAFLAEHGLDVSRVQHMVCHTGGPKVLEAVDEALALPPGALARSWASLETLGNLSSASVLMVLGDLLEARVAQEGDFGLMVAMGPGFGCELVLLRW